MAPLNVGETGRTERTYALLVSGNYFLALGLRPAAGRFIRPDEAAVAGASPIVVLSYDYWQTRFAGSDAAIGQTLQINDNRPTSCRTTHSPGRWPGLPAALSGTLRLRP